MTSCTSCAVNYAARAAGVSRMDNVTSARAKCPGLVTVHTETIDCPEVRESDDTGSESDVDHPRTLVSCVGTRLECPRFSTIGCII